MGKKTGARGEPTYEEFVTIFTRAIVGGVACILLFCVFFLGVMCGYDTYVLEANGYMTPAREILPHRVYTLAELAAGCWMRGRFREIQLAGAPVTTRVMKPIANKYPPWEWVTLVQGEHSAYGVQFDGDTHVYPADMCVRVALTHNMLALEQTPCPE